jgi:CRP-like cAMP-binding protein
VLFREGDLATHLLVIMEGEVTAQTSKQGKPKAFCIFARQEVCGVDEIAADRPYDYTGVCTAEGTEILRVDLPIVQEIFERDLRPDIIDNRKRLSTELKEQHFDKKRLLSSAMSTKTDSRLGCTRLGQRKLVT